MCQSFEYAKGAEASEYAWVCSWIKPEYIWTCLKQNLKKLYKLSSTYRCIGVFMISKYLKWSKKKCLAKSKYSLELFPKETTNIWQGCK